MTGCSHNGIVNIIEVFDNIANTIKTNLLAVIGGFHLYNPVTHEYESKQRIKEIAEWLSNRQPLINWGYSTSEISTPKATSLSASGLFQ